MTLISKDTAMEIALAYREIETAEKLLAEIAKGMKSIDGVDLRDAFGRRQNGLQLGVLHGTGGHTIYDVPWTLCKPIIEGHIAHHRTRIELLTAKAREEMGSP